MGWNLGDVLDRIGTALPPEHVALVHGERRVSWKALTERSNALARAFHARGLTAGDKVAFYMRNQPEYMELLAACLKGRFTHVNINYRYLAAELTYVLDNSDAAAVVYAPEFRALIEAVRPALPKVKLWLETGDHPGRPAFAEAYDDLANGADNGPLDLARLPEDPILLYTGGTTGTPKGVIWPQTYLMQSLLNSLKPLYGYEPETLEELVALVLDQMMHTVQLPVAPLMHATGMCVAMGAMVGGGTVVTLPSDQGFDADALWRAVEENGVTGITIIGDAFAKPMLTALDAAPGKHRLDSVKSMASSGTMWSAAVKDGLLRHMPEVMLLDSLGSTEAPACAATVTTKSGVAQTMDFAIGPDCKVFNERDEEVAPGSGEAGFMARGGLLPLGYYKDEAKTAATFRTINGVRYAIPGDMCRVEADGRMTLLGRSSACINTGGEKVFSEEVEESLKEFPGVEDAIVVGVPDDKWGQAVVAVVALARGASASESQLQAHVRANLAAYKSPKRVFVKDDLERFPNGKANYGRMREHAIAQMMQDA